jgi:hypothetical protein
LWRRFEEALTTAQLLGDRLDVVIYSGLRPVGEFGAARLWLEMKGFTVWKVLARRKKMPNFRHRLVKFGVAQPGAAIYSRSRRTVAICLLQGEAFNSQLQ